jgi:putative spermidine/putrescine transport system substrate-binding protein
MQSYLQDAVELACRRVAEGKLERRSLLGALAALGAAPLAGGSARAQAGREMVMVNWGGLANTGFDTAYAQPFMTDNPGWRVVQDSSGPSAGRIRSMVESGRTTWDLCDSSATSAIFLGRQNLLNKIDYGVVKREDVIGPGFVMEYGAAPYSFSSVLVYDSSKFPTPPTSWADFWDLRRFPGTRLLRKDAVCVLDAAQMSLGRAPASLYPLDVPACLRRMEEIKRNTVYWTSGSESEQFMRTGEAVMGQIWHTRAKVLEDETNGRLKFVWNQGVLQPGIMVSPRGNPGGAMVQRFLGSMLAKPEPQVTLLGILGNGPTNPQAAEKVPANLKRFNPTEPANAAAQVVLGGEWWGANYGDVNQDYMDTITG